MPYCRNCGGNLADADTACPNCGTPATLRENPFAQPAPAAAPPSPVADGPAPPKAEAAPPEAKAAPAKSAYNPYAPGMPKAPGSGHDYQPATEFAPVVQADTAGQPEGHPAQGKPAPAPQWEPPPPAQPPQFGQAAPPQNQPTSAYYGSAYGTGPVVYPNYSNSSGPPASYAPAQAGPMVQPPAKPKSRKKLVVIILVAVVLFWAAIFAIIAASSGAFSNLGPAGNADTGVLHPALAAGTDYAPAAPTPGVAEVPKNYFSYYQLNNSTVYFSLNGGHIDTGERYVSDLTQTSDGSLLYFLLEANWVNTLLESLPEDARTPLLASEENYHSTALFVTNFDGITRYIAGGADNIVLCADNDTMFFNAGDRGNEVYRYRHSTGLVEQVSDKSYTIAASPNGEWLLGFDYDSVYTQPVGGAPVPITLHSSGLTPLAVSNDGDTAAYYVWNSSSGEEEPEYPYSLFLCYKGDVVEELGFDENATICQNLEGDDLLVAGGDALYRFHNGRLDKLDDITSVREFAVLSAGVLGQSQRYSSGASVLNIEDFSHFYYVAESSAHAAEPGNRAIICYDEENGPSSVAMLYSSYRPAMLAANGTTIFYHSNNNLYMVDTTAQPYAPQLLQTKVEDYAISPAGSQIYYTQYLRDENGGDNRLCLFSLTGTGGSYSEAVILDENILRFSIGGPQGESVAYIANANGEYREPGTAWYYTPAADGTRADPTMVMEKATSLSPPSATGAFYVVSGGGSSYSSNPKLNIHIYNGGSLYTIVEKAATSHSLFFDDTIWYQQTTQGRLAGRGW